MMLHDFLEQNRELLIERCRAKVAARPARSATAAQLQNGVPLFLTQLIRTLRAEEASALLDSDRISGVSGGIPALTEMGESAAEHGRSMLALGFTIDQVVHDYADLCQSVTDLAFENNTAFRVEEFRTLNRCLDTAIAEAVTEFSYHRDFLVAERQASVTNERLGFVVHELRNSLNTATLAFHSVKQGNLSLTSSTGSILERSLAKLSSDLDKSLNEVRIGAGISPPSQLFSVAAMIKEVESTTRLAMVGEPCSLFVSDVDARLGLNADREAIAAALGNLLQNAIKFTQPHSEIILNAYAVGNQVRLDVVDHCGGIGDDIVGRMFQPFARRQAGNPGLGLGLVIAKRSTELHGGTLSVRDLPGIGCIFTISLPRHELPEGA